MDILISSCPRCAVGRLQRLHRRHAHVRPTLLPNPPLGADECNWRTRELCPPPREDGRMWQTLLVSHAGPAAAYAVVYPDMEFGRRWGPTRAGPRPPTCEFLA